MAKEIKIFICGECESDYEDLWDAENCCKPDIIEKIQYECEKCQERFPNEHDADEHCANQNLNDFIDRKQNG